MSNKKNIIIATVLFALFIVFAVLLYQYFNKTYKPNKLPNQSQKQNNTDKSDNNTEKENKQNAAPDFTVTDRDGKKVHLSDFKGKPVVLNFWASWCPPCRSEMPHFNAVYAKEKDNVAFVMIDLVDGSRETVSIGKSFIKEQGYSFPVYFDNGQEAAYNYGINSIPTTYFIDAEGNIVSDKKGAMEQSELEQGIASIKSK